MSSLDHKINCVLDDEDAVTSLLRLAESGEKVTARKIRTAIIGPRQHFEQSVVSNAEYYSIFHAIANTTNTSSEYHNAQGGNMFQPKQTPVSSETFIYGQAASSLSKQQLIDAIKRAQSDIKALKDVGVESEYITNEVASLQGAIATMTQLLDA